MKGTENQDTMEVEVGYRLVEFGKEKHSRK